jgi:hypothetical protein
MAFVEARTATFVAVGVCGENHAMALEGSGDLRDIVLLCLQHRA